MSCNYFNKLRDKYLMGDLNDGRLKDLKDHCASCTYCSDALSSYENLLGSIRNEELPQPPEGYWDESIRRILENKAKQPGYPLSDRFRAIFSRFGFNRAIAYASAVFIVMLGFALFTNNEQLDPKDSIIRVSEINPEYANSISMTSQEADQIEELYIKRSMGLEAADSEEMNKVDDYLISISPEDYVIEVFGQEIENLNKKEFQNFIKYLKNKKEA